jgi:hypothetical protein
MTVSEVSCDEEQRPEAEYQRQEFEENDVGIQDVESDVPGTA